MAETELPDAPWVTGGQDSLPDAPWAKTEAETKPPQMFLSEPDASGRRYAIPTTDYNKPEQPTGIGTRMWEGMKAPYEEPLGFSQENLQKYPVLEKLQRYHPGITLGDAVLRAPSAVIGGLTGAAAGLAEPLFGRSWADRLQRDLNLGAQAAAPEIPMEAGALPLRQGARAAQLDRTPLRRPAEPPPIPAEPPPLVPRQVPRPQAGVDLLPADTPHALPPERRSLGAAGAGGPLANVSPETIQYMRQVMEEQGFTPHTIDQRLGELSEHHMFGEITPSLEADMGAIAAPPGPGKLEVMNSLRQRAVEARERVQHVFDRAFGVNENLAQLKRTMAIDRAKAADPFYERFKQTQITPSPALDALMPRLQASGALQSANRKLAVAGEPAARGFPIPGEPPTMQYVPTASAFQYAKEALDDRIAKAAREGEAGDARLYVGLQHDLLNALDTHPQVGDVWRQARSTYAQPTEIMKAADFGQQVLTSKIHPDELPFLTAGYSEPQMAAMRLGMRNYLENMLGKKDALTAEAINAALSPNNIQKMRWAIGDEATEQLVNAMEAERHMHTAPTRVHGGSPTALRLEAQKRWTVQPAGPGMTLQDMAHAAHKPVRTALKKGVEKVAEHIGASKRRELEARMARMREEAARIFTLQGPERDAVARYLVNPEEPLPARKEGGRVGFYRARHAYMIKKQGGGELDSGESWQPGQEDQPAPAPAPPIAEPPPAETPQINQPFGELKPYYPRPTERFTHGLQDLMMTAGANPYSARHMAEGLTGVAGIAPPIGVGMSMADLISASQRRDIGAAIPAAIGAIPMAGRARGAKKAIEEAVTAAEEAFHPSQLAEKYGEIGTHPAERALTVNDILHPDTPAMEARSRNVEDIAHELNQRGAAALRGLDVPESRILGSSPRTDELISRALASEVKSAIERGGNTAQDWYTKAIDEAMQHAATIHPELANDPFQKMGFTAALAVTSQGETVSSNVRLAEQAYDYFKRNGRFPTDIKAKTGPAMNANFNKLNTLLDELGPEGTREFLHTPFTVRDLKKMGHDVGKENMDTKVYGSSILGPKIGGGFYQNLNGNYDPVTMDLWFMRGWGRLTGTLVGKPEVLPKATQRLTDAMREAGMKVPRNQDKLTEVANDVMAKHERDFRTNRADYDSGAKTKSELTLAADRYLANLRGINETPTSGSQREWMRARVNRARELLAEQGHNLTNADLQAIWWYPEKELYSKLGGRDSEAINTDYATVFRDLAAKRAAGQP